MLAVIGTSVVIEAHVQLQNNVQARSYHGASIQYTVAMVRA